MTRADAICVHTHVGILQFLGVVVVQRVAQTVAELQLRNQLEERQIEVAAKAHLHKQVRLFQLDILLVLACQVHHRVDASHHIRPVVVPAFGRELHVQREGLSTLLIEIVSGLEKNL